MTLITTNTSSNAASSDFTSGIDSTYKLYIFKFLDIGPATDEASLRIEASTDSGSSYGVTKTTTWFYALHSEADSTAFTYSAGLDVAQATTAQILLSTMGNGADESGAGTLWLFNPSNTTYVKHFYSRFNTYRSDNESQDSFPAGYFNTTSAIDAVKFTMSSGNFDGVIQMYGIS